jgi:hypothetical protein
MQLLVQVLGAFAAGLLVWVLARSLGLRGRQAAATVAVVAIVAGALLAAPGIRNAIAGFTEQRHGNEVFSDEEKRVVAGSFIEPNEEFINWTAERIGPEEEFQLIVPESGQGEQLTQWMSYRLEPRVEVLDAPAGGWVVFYGVSPAVYDRPAFEELQVYEPGFAIARSKRGT